MAYEEQETLAYQRQDPGGFYSKNLELHGLDQGGRAFVIPLHRRTCTLGSDPRSDFVIPNGPSLRFGWLDDNLTFHCEEAELLLNGEPLHSGQLSLGDVLEFAGHRLILWDRSRAADFLRGYTAPFAGMVWPLHSQEIGIGRAPGNQIRLDHPTVSRAHARLRLEGSACRLLALSRTNLPILNGSYIAPETWVDLNAGDLLEFGELLFRYFGSQKPPGPDQQHPPLNIRFFGMLEVSLGNQPVGQAVWKTRWMKWLLARVVFAWGRPVLCDTIEEMLWPEIEQSKARDRLNSSVSRLRKILAGEGQADYLLRGVDCVSANPDLLGQNDLLELENALRVQSADPLTNLEQIHQICRGEFLEGCYLDWACNLRRDLEQRVGEACRLGLQRADEAQADPQRLLDHAHWCLGLDPCCQVSARVLMSCHRRLGAPTEALKVFQRVSSALNRELQVEPDLELMRESYRARALL
ncbi:MAG: FHA domain-containing protein [Vulcanimicrobiota bacterium]